MRRTLDGAMTARAARRWVGTPYQHQASAFGRGADCLGLIRGIWRDVYGDEPQAVPPYGPDWAERGEREWLLDAARRWLVQRPQGQVQLGDVLLFRMGDGALVKHCGVVTDLAGPEPRMVHAYWARAVVESWLGQWWSRRLVGAFGWPDKEGDGQ